MSETAGATAPSTGNQYLQEYVRLRGRASVLATKLAVLAARPASEERDLRIAALRFVQQNPEWDGEPEEPEGESDPEGQGTHGIIPGDGNSTQSGWHNPQME